MSTECLEVRAEKQKEVADIAKNVGILPCLHQIFASREYIEIKDVGDLSGKSVVRIMKSPSLSYKTNCSRCINDEGNFMCREYKPIKIRTFEVKETSAVRDYSEPLEIVDSEEVLEETSEPAYT